MKLKPPEQMDAAGFGGAAIGAVFGELLKLVIDVAKTAYHFKSNLDHIKTTLIYLQLKIDSIAESNKDLNSASEETSMFVDQLKDGKKLLLNCSKIKPWNLVRKYKYSNKLTEFRESLLLFFQVDVQVQLACHSKKAYHEVADSPQKRSTKANKDEVGVSQVPQSGQIVSQKLKIFTYAELKIATSNFRQLLGRGGFGKVFKGWINEKTFSPTKPNVGMPIAVKISNPDSMQGFEEWQSELEISGRYIHPNLVKLLGYCYEEERILLVYEYMPKGSLENYIFRKNIEPLSWTTRLKIATGAAKGLSFLHSAEKYIIKRDFKSSNILLDDDFNPKLSDLVVCPFFPIHYNQDQGHLYVKSDVYGFGVVLLELLTGLRALDVNRPPRQHNLMDYALPILKEKRKLKSIVDSRLELNYPPKGALRLAALVLRCVEAIPGDRPPMREVVETLEQIQLK